MFSRILREHADETHVWFASRRSYGDVSLTDSSRRRRPNGNLRVDEPVDDKKRNINSYYFSSGTRKSKTVNRNSGKVSLAELYTPRAIVYLYSNRKREKKNIAQH